MKKIRISLALGFFTTISLGYSIILKKSLNLDLAIVLRYLLVGALVTSYSVFLNHFDLKLAHKTFVISVLISNLYLILFMPVVSEGFNDLGIILTWMIINIIGVLSGLFLQFIVYIKDKYNQ